MKCYLVGGAVRDDLLGLPVGERDWVVVGSTPQAMLQQGFRPVGKDFPVFLHPQTNEEYALARTERKTGRGYHGFTFYTDPTTTLEEDLQRRDLTINAMARDSDGQLIDPYGGQADLAARRLRHVSEAFREDPLRVLRVARFAARLAPLGFTVAPETLDLMRHIVHGGELADLAAERVWRELWKALSESSPATFFEVIHACGGLAYLLPELDWPWTGDTPPLSISILKAAAALSNDPSIRFAALIQAIAVNEQSLSTIVSRLKAPNEPATLARLAHRHRALAHQASHFSAPDLLNLLEILDALRKPERLPALLTIWQADAAARTHSKEFPQHNQLTTALRAALAVNARDIDVLDLSGPAIGEAVRQARILAIEQSLRNT